MSEYAGDDFQILKEIGRGGMRSNLSRAAIVHRSIGRLKDSLLPYSGFQEPKTTVFK